MDNLEILFSYYNLFLRSETPEKCVLNVIGIIDVTFVYFHSVNLFC